MEGHVFRRPSLNPLKRPSPFSDYQNIRSMVRSSDSSLSSENSTYRTFSSLSEGETTKAIDLPQALREMETSRSLRYHLSLLNSEPHQEERDELATSPIFIASVLKHAEALIDKENRKVFPQYGLLAGLTDCLPDDPRVKQEGEETRPPPQDPRIFFNIAAPSSTFICGSQGSGKSHTLSCLLESCLISSEANKLPKPLTGLIFHYDTFISDHGGAPCEAAYLASDPAITVRVLCSPTNIRTIKSAYQFLNVEVEPLILREADLNTKRMLDLMAVSRDDGPMPLYLHSIYRILRDMRIAQQDTQGKFSYAEFKRQVMDTPMTPAQLGPLNQRLSTLESFMSKANKGKTGNSWKPTPGSLTIVDLSCPCVTPEGACALFNICLSIFLEQEIETGRVIALDEAHKFMNASTEAHTLTDTLLTAIRLQRHLGARIIISTQEPTISPALLDLSSITIVHRFTSPEWLRVLKQHLAAAASDLVDQNFESSATRETETSDERISNGGNDTAKKIFGDIVRLRVGEALLFSPSAMVGIEISSRAEVKMKRLGSAYLKVRIRKRLTTDGGKSVMAS